MSLLNSLASAAAGKILGGGGAGAASLLPVLLEQFKNYPGGLMGLVSSFQKGGLGEIIASWIGKGANQPVTESQLGSVLDAGWLGKVASAAGQETSGVLSVLTDLLPKAVDKATPDGELPAGGVDMAGLLGSLSGLFGNKG